MRPEPTEVEAGISSLSRSVRIAVALLLLLVASCAPVRHLSDLVKPRFSIDRISSVSLSGIELMDIDSIDHLDISELASATMAFARGNLPLELAVHLKSENPLINRMRLTLLKLQWAAVINGREAARGELTEPVELPPGKISDIPIPLTLNMVDLFSGASMIDMFALALTYTRSADRHPVDFRLKIRPVVDTPFGVVEYDEMVIEPGAIAPSSRPDGR